MTKRIETRLDDLERKAGADDQQIKVVVSWDDPNFPDKINEGDEVIQLTWGEDDEIIRTVRQPGSGYKE